MLVDLIFSLNAKKNLQKIPPTYVIDRGLRYTLSICMNFAQMVISNNFRFSIIVFPIAQLFLSLRELDIFWENPPIATKY